MHDQAFKGLQCINTCQYGWEQGQEQLDIEKLVLFSEHPSSHPQNARRSSHLTLMIEVARFIISIISIKILGGCSLRHNSIVQLHVLVEAMPNVRWT